MTSFVQAAAVQMRTRTASFCCVYFFFQDANVHAYSKSSAANWFEARDMYRFIDNEDMWHFVNDAEMYRFVGDAETYRFVDDADIFRFVNDADSYRFVTDAYVHVISAYFAPCCLTWVVCNVCHAVQRFIFERRLCALRVLATR